jgi:hypothetical protein
MTELEIRLSDGEALELGPNPSLQLEMLSPLFETELWGGTFSYPFTLPWTPQNARKLGYLNHRQSAADRKRKYQVGLYYGGLLRECLMEIRSVSGRSVSVDLVSPEGGLDDTMRSKLLTELDLGSETLPTTFVTSNHYAAQMGAFNPALGRVLRGRYRIYRDNVEIVYFELDNLGSRLDQEEANNLVILSSYINEAANNFPIRSQAYGNALVIYPLDGTVSSYRITRRLDLYNESDDFLGFQNGEADFTRLVYRTIAPFPNATVNFGPGDKYAFPMVRNTHFYGDPSSETANKQYVGYVNYYDGGYKHNSPGQPLKYTLCPMLFLSFALEKIFASFGYTVEGDFLQHPAVVRMLIYSLQSLDLQQPDAIFPFNTFNPTLAYAKLLPSITLEELMTALRNAFALAYQFDTPKKKLTMRFIKEVLETECQTDWSAKCDPEFEDDLTFGNEVSLSFRLESDDNTAKANDQGVLPELFRPFGTGEEPIEVALSSLLTKAQEGLQLPYTEQKGVSPFFGLGETKFGLRLLFWHGLASGSRSYPKASNEYDDGAGNRVALQWGGPYGLHEQFWKEYAAFRARTYATEQPAALDARDLAGLDYFSPKHVLGVNYFVKKLVVTLPLRKPATVTLCKI